MNYLHKQKADVFTTIIHNLNDLTLLILSILGRPHFENSKRLLFCNWLSYCLADFFILPLSLYFRFNLNSLGSNTRSIFQTVIH